MRKSASIFIVLAAATATMPLAAERRVVEVPQVSASNTKTLTITSVDLTPDSTVVSFQANYLPGHWIRIAPATYLRSHGKNYQLLGSSNLKIGENFWMPKSGVADFTLTFSPLPTSAESFDFIENVPDGFCIYGVNISSAPKKVRRQSAKGTQYFQRFSEEKYAQYNYISPMMLNTMKGYIDLKESEMKYIDSRSLSSVENLELYDSNKLPEIQALVNQIIKENHLEEFYSSRAYPQVSEIYAAMSSDGSTVSKLLFFAYTGDKRHTIKAVYLEGAIPSVILGSNVGTIKL